MNHQALIDVLKKLNLAPGIYHVELPEHEIVITVRSRTAADMTQDSAVEAEVKYTSEIPVYADEAGMLEPWVELPRPKPIGTVLAYPAAPPSPDIPKIPRWDEGE